MWNGTPFIYERRFNNVVLDLANPELTRFYQEFVLQDPESGGVPVNRPIFPAIESFVISFMTKDHHNILKKLYYDQLNDFFAILAQVLTEDPAFLLKTLNRDPQGQRKNFPRVPLPGVPELRTIFDFEDPPESLSSADWGITPIRFLLHFRPVIQEYLSEDSGIDD